MIDILSCKEDATQLRERGGPRRPGRRSGGGGGGGSLPLPLFTPHSSLSPPLPLFHSQPPRITGGRFYYSRISTSAPDRGLMLQLRRAREGPQRRAKKKGRLLLAAATPPLLARTPTGLWSKLGGTMPSAADGPHSDDLARFWEQAVPRSGVGRGGGEGGGGRELSSPLFLSPASITAWRPPLSFPDRRRTARHGRIS